MNSFTIIDLETTGFGRHDRIVEVGLVKINLEGEVIDTYSTLVNPNRDVSASHIHGITATMVKNAPTFADIHSFINEFIIDSVPVSHQKTFDFNFLKKEMNLCGVEDYPLEGLCTLQLSRSIFPDLPCRKLSSLCEYFDIDVKSYHSALDDSLATAKVLAILLDEIEDKVEYPTHGFHISSNTSERIEFNREKSSLIQEKELSKLSNLIKNQPDFDSHGDYHVSEYLNLLDRILQDRIITDEEVFLVKEYANGFKIPASAISKIHEEYYRRLCNTYLDDDEISEPEATDLNLVGKLLGINSTTSSIILELEKDHSTINAKVYTPNIHLNKAVCFTGALSCKIHGNIITKEKAHELAISKGLTIKKGVSSKLDLLVVADPNTNSRKAKQARELTIPIIAEMVFWNQIGIATE
jgi:DNA polymerase-3 subunit epsilon